MRTMTELANRRLLILVGPDYQDLELWYPRLRLTEAGAAVIVAGSSAGVTYRGKHGYPCVAEAAIGEQSSTLYDGLLVPGGPMPRMLCQLPAALRLTREFAAAGRLIATICRGGLVPAAAGVFGGVRTTGYPEIRLELERAGAIWADAPVVIDRQFISSRGPDDLPQFCHAIIDQLCTMRIVS